MFKGKSSLLSIHRIGGEKKVQHISSYNTEKCSATTMKKCSRKMRIGYEGFSDHFPTWQVWLLWMTPEYSLPWSLWEKNSRVLAHRWEKAVPYEVLHSLWFLPFCRARTKNNGSSLYVLTDCSSWAFCQRVMCCCLALGFKHRNGHLSIVEFSKLKKEQPAEMRKEMENKTWK